MNQRPIKFRAWDAVKRRLEGQFTKIAVAEDRTAYSFIAFNFTSNMGHPDLVTIPEIESDPKRYFLMQFTGLKDKNGKEIYEGDILRFETVHHRTHSTLTNEHVEWRGLSLYPFSRDNKGSYEIIGNIYENPHLLSHEA